MHGTLWRWVERRLRRTLPPAHADSTLGDLEEDFGRRRAATGPIRASLWLIAEARSLRSAYRALAVADAPVVRPRLMLSDDLGHAWKRLTSNLAVPLLCAALLGIGIGLSTAMFSVVDSLLLRPAPFPDADRLVQQSFWRTEPGVMDAWRTSGLFESVEAARLRPFELDVAGGGTVVGAFVSPGVFEMLQIRAVRGRLLAIHDAHAGSDDGIVLSESVWRSAFGGDPAVVGRRERFGDASFVVVGIAPADLRFPTPSTMAWRAFDPGVGGTEPATIFGQLSPGIAREAAAPAAATFARALARLPDGYTGSPQLNPLGRPVADSLTRRGVWLLFGGVALVFAVLCGNVSTLLLTPLTKRQREFATLAALGASRSRLIRQASFEHVTIGVAGAAGGIVLATALVGWIPALFQQRTLNIIDVDPRALIVATALSVAAVIAAGLAPAWLGTRSMPADSLRGSRQGETRAARLATRGLLAGQVALACSLLIASALLLRSFQQLATADRGLTLDGIVTVDLTQLDEAFTRGPAMALGTAAIAAEMSSWPEVAELALSREIPPSWSEALVRANGAVDWTAAPRADRYRVGTSFFEVYGISVVRGRGFARDDEPAVAIVSEDLARLLWPGRDPLGEPLEVGRTTARVVGVTREIRLPTLDASLDRPEFYVPLGSDSRTLSASLRCRPACRSERAMHERLATIHPLIRPRIRPPVGAAFLEQLELPRAVARIGSVFAVVAVLTAAGGLFSVMTSAVARRRREFGIRTALGATASQTRRAVFREALQIAGAGVVAGIAGGWVIGRSMSAFHYDVSPADPLSWTAVMATIALAAVAAAWRPAVEAARVDPAELLRDE